MPDGTTDTTTTTTGTGTTTSGQDDAAYFRAEAQKAFEARDKLKARVRELEGKVLSDEDRELFDTLKGQAEKTEEDRKKKAGEFESLRTQLTEKHAKELHDKDTKLSALSDRFKQTVIKAEFGAASDYFSGSESSKTILDVDLGMAALGRFVRVDDVDNDPLGYRVVVTKPNGETILGSDGNPAPFAEAIGELIKLLPNKDRILRGSGKTGSGSSGGSTHAVHPADVAELTRRAQQGDKDAIEQLQRRRRNSGALVMGSAFTR